MAGKFETPTTETHKPLDYKKMDMDDIIKWCQANGQVEWLKKTMEKKSVVTRYPKKLDEYNRPITYTEKDKKGKVKKHYVLDKTAEPIVEEKPISFTKIKELFVSKFMPEIKPNYGKKKPKTMQERVAEL